jgi:hypothetical protein
MTKKINEETKVAGTPAVPAEKEELVTASERHHSMAMNSLQELIDDMDLAAVRAKNKQDQKVLMDFSARLKTILEELKY